MESRDGLTDMDFITENKQSRITASLNDRGSDVTFGQPGAFQHLSRPQNSNNGHPGTHIDEDQEGKSIGIAQTNYLSKSNASSVSRPDVSDFSVVTPNIPELKRRPTNYKDQEGLLFGQASAQEEEK